MATPIERQAAKLMKFFQRNICPFDEEDSEEWPVRIEVDEDMAPELARLMRDLEDKLVDAGLMSPYRMPME
jgi:hypothetical protein